MQRLTYDEALIQAAKDVAQDNQLPKVKVYRQMGQHSAEERQLAILILASDITFCRQRSHLQNEISSQFQENW